ncbi:DUF1015 family protein [Saccharopolyspora cebuensis]|uniref:DUF1015 family protein n=1 Tax=Saccharopolyspora cebuensis TaxID=418759 RepID=A0ABV4CIC3_9PSEU
MPESSPHRVAPRRAGTERGVVVEPFRGWRIAPERMRELAGRYATPWGQLTDLSDGAAQEAAAVLRSWQRSGTVLREPRDALYAYRQSGPHGDQRGVLGAVHLDSRLLPHQDVLPERAEALSRMMATGGLDLGPLLLGYSGTGTTAGHLDALGQRPPTAEVLGPDGQRHQLWRITQPAVHEEIAAELARSPALLADGHHRWIAARQLRRLRHARGSGTGPWDYASALLVDTRRSPLLVAPVHRVLPAADPWTALDSAAGAFRMTRLRGDLGEWLRVLRHTAEHTTAFAVVTGHGTFLLTDPVEPLLAEALAAVPAPLHRMQLAVLHAALIDWLWRVPAAPGAIGYESSPGRAVRRVQRDGGIAVLVTPPRQAELRSAFSAGLRLPCKSTAFRPVPHPGLVLRAVDG